MISRQARIWLFVFSLFVCMGALAALPFSAFSASADNDSIWQIWLGSEEKIMPFARETTLVATESGLDGLTDLISSGISDLEQGKVARDKAGMHIASIWAASINAALLQGIDPFPNPRYQEIIDQGMNYAGDRLNVPNIEEDMELTARTIIKCQKQMR